MRKIKLFFYSKTEEIGSLANVCASLLREVETDEEGEGEEEEPEPDVDGVDRLILVEDGDFMILDSLAEELPVVNDFFNARLRWFSILTEEDGAFVLVHFGRYNKPAAVCERFESLFG